MSFLNAQTSEGVEKKLYTGITEVKVLGFNPTVENIAKIYNTEESKIKDPKYTTPDYTKLDCYIKKDEPSMINKITFFVSNKDVQGSLSGKYQFINTKGQSCWSIGLEALKSDKNLDWFDKGDFRIAKEGEVKLYSFLIALFNIDVTNKENNLKLESWDKIAKGDCTELNKYIEHFRKTLGYDSLKVLLGVKDGQYQDVFSEAFCRKSQSNYSYLMKTAMAEKGGFRSFFGNSPVFQEFDPNAIAPTTNTFAPPVEEFIFQKPESTTPWKEPIVDNPFTDSEPTKKESDNLFG